MQMWKRLSKNPVVQTRIFSNCQNATSSPLSWCTPLPPLRRAASTHTVRCAAADPLPLNARRKGDLPTYDLTALLDVSSPSLLSFLLSLNEHGLVLVTGLSSDTGPADLAAALSPATRLPMPTMYGLSFRVESTENAINVAYTSAPLSLHTDLVYMESPPGLQLLGCRAFAPSLEGGNSTFLDGLVAVERLRTRDPRSFAALTRIPATFQKIHYEREHPAHIAARKPIIVLDRSLVPAGEAAADPTTGVVVGLNWAPPFEGPLDVLPEDVAPFRAAYAAFAATLDSCEAEGAGFLEFRLAPGEMVVFNNRRVLHGRRGFEPVPGARLLIGAYVSANDWMSRLHTLAKKHGRNEPLKRAWAGLVFA